MSKILEITGFGSMKGLRMSSMFSYPPRGIYTRIPPVSGHLEYTRRHSTASPQYSTGFVVPAPQSNGSAKIRHGNTVPPSLIPTLSSIQLNSKLPHVESFVSLTSQDERQRYIQQFALRLRRHPLRRHRRHDASPRPPQLSLSH
jgi:hypothetical protein